MPIGREILLALPDILDDTQRQVWPEGGRVAEQWSSGARAQVALSKLNNVLDIDGYTAAAIECVDSLGADAEALKARALGAACCVSGM